jgi:hypothetical protein
MANNLQTVAYTGNYPLLLARQMRMEALKSQFWGKMAKYTSKNGKFVRNVEEVGAVLGAPIVMHNELQKQSGTAMQVPMLRQLVNMPKYTGQQLVGHEEDIKGNHATVHVDIFRHAVRPQDTEMGTPATKSLQLLQKSRPLLQSHYSRVHEHLGVNHAFYYGYSWNVIKGTSYASNPYAKPVKTYHPHIYTAGGGKVTYSNGYPGTPGYTASLVTAIQAITDSHVFDTQFLDFLASDQQIKMIPPLSTKDGVQYRGIVAHPWQIKTLRDDQAFREVQAQAWIQNRAKDNPYLIGASYYWNGFVIYEHDSPTWPVNIEGSDTPVFGAFVGGDPISLKAFDNYEEYNGIPNTRFAGIVFGDNAMFRANASEIEFIQETFDYKSIIGVGYRQLTGYARGDYWNLDDGEAGQYVINDGSAIFITAALRPTP